MRSPLEGQHDPRTGGWSLGPQWPMTWRVQECQVGPQRPVITGVGTSIMGHQGKVRW